MNGRRAVAAADHMREQGMVDTLSVVTHEDYLVAVTTVVCEQYLSTAAALLDPLHRAWGGE